MAINYPGPYELRIFYSVDTSPGGVLQHQVRLNCDLDPAPDPGDLFGTINCKLSGGTTTLLSTVVDNVVNWFEDILSGADATIDYAELWKYTVGTFQATYLSTYAIGTPGTHVGATVPASQSIFTFRSTNGGIMRYTIMDTTGSPNVPAAYADLSAVNKAIVDYITSDTISPYLCRDNGRPYAFLKLYPGQNEHAFKVRYGRT